MCSDWWHRRTVVPFRTVVWGRTLYNNCCVRFIFLIGHTRDLRQKITSCIGAHYTTNCRDLFYVGSTSDLKQIGQHGQHGARAAPVRWRYSDSESDKSRLQSAELSISGPTLLTWASPHSSGRAWCDTNFIIPFILDMCLICLRYSRATDPHTTHNTV